MAGDQRAEGRGCGKAILVGEHFVLDGATAVALSLPAFQTRVRLQALAEVLPGGVSLCRGGARLTDGERAQTELMVRRALREAGEERCVRASIASSIPLRRGFGSSAALAVAAVQAAFGLAGLGRPDDETWLGASRRVECVVHGRSSGLDPATAMARGAVRFRDGRPRGQVHIGRNGTLSEARWILIDLGPGPATSDVIGRANRARARLGEARLRALVARADEAAARAIAGLEAGEAETVAAAMDEAGACLERLDVVDDLMRRVMSLCRRAGAMSVKQTGAGRGGALLALAPDARIADTIRGLIAGHIEAAWTLETTP